MCADLLLCKCFAQLVSLWTTNIFSIICNSTAVQYFVGYQSMSTGKMMSAVLKAPLGPCRLPVSEFHKAL